MPESWVLLTLASAAALGIYEVAKKVSVRDNAVAPVLYLNAAVCALVWLPFVIWSWLSITSIPLPALQVNRLSAIEHAALFGKSAIVGTSWSLAYFAVKQLPISISSPIRATSPIWTVLFATLVLSEDPSLQQWFGMVVVLVAFFAFSRVGKQEGIVFYRDKWVGLMMLATLFAAVSSLYDKFLLQRMKIDVSTVQAWFSIYLLIVLAPLLVHWWRYQRDLAPFHFRWSIVWIAMALLVADFLYFSAIAQPEAMISVISTLRRTSIIVSFVIGIFCLGEKNFWRKLACISCMLAGVAMVTLG